MMERMRKAIGSVRVIAAAIAVIGMFQPAQCESQGERSVPEQRLLDDRIDALVQRLAHTSFQSRENARWELQQIGLPAYEKLREAISNPNVEIASSARYLVHSFKVVWWLETDSLAVRQLLRDYNELSATDCVSRMQQLAEQQSADGYQALVRLARYESREQLSKSAALCLMEVYLDPRNPLNKVNLSNWIQQGVDDSSRSSARWLMEFANVLVDERSDAGAWKAFVDEEHRQVASSAPSSSEQIASRLYAWIGQWLAQTGRRELALQLSRPRLELVASERSLILSAAHWAIDANLPELVEELAQNHADAFSSYPQLRYLLAESFLKLNRIDASKLAAQEASDLVGQTLRRVQMLKGKPAPENESLERLSITSILLDRGMFDWAEAELLRALQLETPPGFETVVRRYLADFYWDAGANDLAAKVWEPVLKKAKEQPDYADQLRRDANSDRLNALEEITGNWHFFRGLAAIDSGDNKTARHELDLAFETIRNNPDILIAMTKVADGGEYRQRMDQRIVQMVNEFRAEILTEEQTLARESVRRERKQIEEKLATACNQLAWLLACTVRSQREAISLSQRSLALSPNNSTYLDTLGRCYFAAGELQKAVEVQAQAVQLEPFRRQMQRQLTEFQKAAGSEPTARQ